MRKFSGKSILENELRIPKTVILNTKYCKTVKKTVNPAKKLCTENFTYTKLPLKIYQNLLPEERKENI